MLNGYFPTLKTLSLAQNELESMAPSENPQMISLASIETLVLEKNAFRSLSPLASMSSAFPQLKDLSLQQNRIDKIGELNAAEMSNLNLFKSLRSLNLSRNMITDFAFVDQLALLFPSLTSLRISNNPLYENFSASVPGQPNTRSDIPYSFTVARIPSLNVLNYTTITSRDREEGEIYYISTAGKEIAALLEATVDQDRSATINLAQSKHPRYEALCRQYDRDSVFDQYTLDLGNSRSSKPVQTSVAGSLAARLVVATFYVPASSHQVLKRKLARTIDVYRIKALISREMKLRPLQFRLIYESEELDPIRDSVEQKSSDWETWGDWDVDDDVESDIAESQSAPENILHETWTDGVLLRDGKKWKKREVEIVDGTKAWGDYIGDDEIRAVTVRVEPLDTF
jgi:tubulin-specific chaperone E